jgi:hypothetical protein
MRPLIDTYCTLSNCFFSFYIMTKTLALTLLAQGNTGEQILQILDTLVEDMTQENINDAAAHYAAISTGTLEAIDF